MLRLFNTLTRSVDEFSPLKEGTVSLYTCGPTVYNYAHIGNLRMYVFEDLLKRAIVFCGYRLQHVMNVTDVGHLVSDADVGEDKMALGAQREGKSVWEIAEFYWQSFRDDMARLNLIEPDVWCRATEHIQEQIDLVRQLEQKGYTYVIEDGVYFDTAKAPDYGKLARLDLEGLKAGARVEMVAGKRNPTDFALWKFSPKDAKRLMEWDSPWGVGFPGWHTECAAMAIKYLGERLDIHCGGIDHVPVHHTNEIAQAEGVLGHQWVNWWSHGEFLIFGSQGGIEKMSKSAGGFITLQTLIDDGYDALAYRYFCMNGHYRAQLMFTREGLDAAQNAFTRLKHTALDLRQHHEPSQQPIEAHMSAFREAVEDDLNIPRALAAMWSALKDPAASPGEKYATLLAMDPVLGFGFDQMTAEQLAISEQEIDDLIAQRNAARKARDFTRADEIRDHLAAQGVTLEDTPGGTIWRRAR